jgi:hypothetical protein
MLSFNDIKNSFGNQTVTNLKAILVVKNDSSPYLIEKDIKYDNEFKIYLNFKYLEDILLNNIGCFVGGRELYYDGVIVSGVIKRSNLELFVLDEINKFLLIREDEEFNILELE